MPRNNKKEKIKEAIIKDEQTLVAIAREFEVKQPYISQLKIEVDRDKYLENLKFMWEIMNSKMTWKSKPSNTEKEQLKKVRSYI